jgi:hypothetical protein
MSGENRPLWVIIFSMSGLMTGTKRDRSFENEKNRP